MCGARFSLCNCVNTPHRSCMNFNPLGTKECVHGLLPHSVICRALHLCLYNENRKLPNLRLWARTQSMLSRIPLYQLLHWKHWSHIQPILHVGIRFTGSSESEPSAHIVPTHLASWYMTFDLPCSFRWCIPWLVSSRKSDGTDIWLMRLNNWERILSCWLGCKLSRVCLQTSNTIERSPAGTTVGRKICISEVEEHSLSVSNFSSCTS